MWDGNGNTNDKIDNIDKFGIVILFWWMTFHNGNPSAATFTQRKKTEWNFKCDLNWWLHSKGKDRHDPFNESLILSECPIRDSPVKTI